MFVIRRFDVEEASQTIVFSFIRQDPFGSRPSYISLQPKWLVIDGTAGPVIKGFSGFHPKTFEVSLREWP
ncbi:hypothetical protein AJ87_37320 [Rhizobium yanglingense]|nr:hypothetical protein AJ87_37320 [Rhizobium yanglingense]